MYCEVIASWFGCGFSSKAPGTVGSLAAIPLIVPIITWHWSLGIIISVATFLIGLHATSLYLRKYPQSRDPSQVVVDEVCGQVLTLSIPVTLAKLGIIPLCTLEKLCCVITLIVASVLAFRFFDIVKPWPVCWADEKVKNALGVMLDDVLAACQSALLLIGTMNALSLCGVTVCC